MIRIQELEKHFGKSFDEIIKSGDIIKIADTTENAFEDYVLWERANFKENVEHLKDDFYKWVENCNADDLLNYELSTYQRHFKLENGSIYYLNSYL